MHERQEQSTGVLKAALAYFERFPISPEPPLLTGKRRQLQETLDRIAASAKAQTLGYTRDPGLLDRRRKELREKRMLPLRQLATAELRFAPGAEAALRVPHARASARVVAAAAVRMADALMPHARLLRAAGVSKDFLIQMRQEAHALALTTRENAAKRKRRTEATAAIAAEIKKGLAIVATLEGLVLLHATPENVDLLRNTRRRMKKVGRPRKPRRRKPSLTPVT